MILAAGVSLHGYTPSAHASGPTGDARAVLRAKLQAYENHQQHQAELSQVLLNFDDPKTHLKYPLHKALLAHHEEFGVSGRGVLLAEHQGKVLEVHREAPHVRVTTNGQLEPMDASLLAHFGIHRTDQLQASMRNVLLSQTNLPTDPPPNDSYIVEHVTSSVHEAKVKRLALTQHADAALLGRYHNEVTLALQPTATALELTNSGDERLELSGPHLYVNTGASRTATTGDLRRLNLADPPQVEAALGRLMVRLAGITGAPDAPDTVESARKKLLGRIGDVHALAQWINSPGGHPDLQLLLQVRSVGHHADSVLVTQGSEQLVLKEWVTVRGVLHTRHEMRLVVRKNAQSTAAVDEESVATIADLHRFKLSTLAQFDAMVLKVVEGLDPSEIPDVPVP